jgi:hypothetical protein
MIFNIHPKKKRCDRLHGPIGGVSFTPRCTATHRKCRLFRQALAHWLPTPIEREDTLFFEVLRVIWPLGDERRPTIAWTRM